MIAYMELALPFVFLTLQLPVAAADYVRGCYFTNWAQYRPGRGKYEPEQYQPGLCTHMFFAFGWMNEDFTIRAYDPTDLPVSWKPKGGTYQRVNRLKQRDPQLKTLLSIGGWTFGTRLFTAMAKSPSGRQVFINSAIKFVVKNGFDGLDIDWEYPKGVKNEYITFIRELRQAFDNYPTKLLLTCAVGAAPETVDAAYHVPAMAQLFDFIMLMSYDFHGSWESVTGLNSPLTGGPHDKPEHKDWNTVGSAEYWHKSGMPRAKLVIGIAAYGRGWTLADPNKHGIGAPTTGPSTATTFAREAGIISYYELCALESSGATKEWSDDYGVPYLYKGNQWFGYDDRRSVANKMKWVKSKGYGGAFVWTLDLDDFNGDCGQGRFPLLNTIRHELTGRGPPNPFTHKPTPSPYNTPPNTPTNTRWKPASKPSTTPKSNGPFQCLSDGFHINPSSCASFYRCVGGRAHYFDCPAGLHFNAAVTACDWPRNVACSIIRY